MILKSIQKYWPLTQLVKCPCKFGVPSIHFVDYSNYSTVSKERIKTGPGLSHFIGNQVKIVDRSPHPYLDESNLGYGQKVFFDIYGCQMNVNDADIVWSVLKTSGFTKASSVEEADIILIVTCSIRDNAEMKIWSKLADYKSLQKKRTSVGLRKSKIGVLGCMAERLKHKLIEEEKAIDVVAGPDSYRDLPRLLSLAAGGQSAVNVALSLEETYADIIPVRLNEGSISAFVSVMRGCDNMCSYCIVPFTRGRERSRPHLSILEEIKHLSDFGVKEVTLLGQNVNSYLDLSDKSSNFGKVKLTEGFRSVYKTKSGGMKFAELLDRASQDNPNMRIRFTSPHPKDFPDEVLQVIAARPNVCSHVHLPAQSGNSRVLELMRRGYSRESYIQLVDRIRSWIPEVTLSSDFICGFCSETEEEFQDTLSLISLIKYDTAYVFSYSMREKTHAHRRLNDDVPATVKQDRLTRLFDTYRQYSAELNQKKVGKVQLVLLEGESRRSAGDLVGRNDGNTRVVVPIKEIPVSRGREELVSIQAGMFVAVKIVSSTSQSLIGEPLYVSNISDFATCQS